MSAEGGNQEPKPTWDKVRLLKTNDGTLWYRTKTGEVVVLDDAAEDEKSRQQNEPDTPPTEGYPEFSQRIGTEELPLTDPDAIERKRADMELLVNNLVDIDTDLRTSLIEEIVGAEDDGDLEAIKTGIDQILKDKRDAARAAAGGAAGTVGAGKSPQEIYDEAKLKFKEKHAKKRAEERAERDAVAELDAEEAAANPPKSIDDIYTETKEVTKHRHAKKRAISKAEREAIAELDAEEAAARPPETPKTPDEILADLQKAETDRIERRELEERAKKNARDAIDAARKQKLSAETAAEFARAKAQYEARYDNLRRNGIIDDTASILAEGEVAQAQTLEDLARFDDELKGLEARLPENPAPDETTNEITARNAEFAQLTRDAISNIEAIIEAGGNPNSIYERYRKRFRASNLKYFDVELQRHEARTGKPFGIEYGSMTPAERMRYKNPPPAFADNYTANGRIDRAWQAHDIEKYGDLVPFAIDEIRNDPKRKALYDRFLKAVEYDNTLMKTVEEGKPLDAAQRKLLEYSQYEFTNQYKRAEVLSEMFTPEFTKKLMYQNEFVNSMAVMYGTEKTAAFMKDDVFRIAMEDLGTFDRLANAAIRLNNLGSSKRNAMRRGEEQFEMANVFEDRLRDKDLQRAMEKESMTGEKSVENLPPPKEMSDEFSAANLQKYFDRDKMKAMIGDRGWDKWTDTERKEFKRRWEPEEIKEKRKNKEAGFYAQLKSVIMEALFGEQKKQVTAH